MDTSDFDFELPAALIAQHPAATRDRSRLLVVDRRDGRLHHTGFRHLTRWLSDDDLVVVNDSRVFPARLRGRFEDTAGAVEVLLLREVGCRCWRALVKPARRCRPQRRIVFSQGQTATVLPDETEGAIRLLRFEGSADLMNWLEKWGEVPLPPYIDRPPEPADTDRYQTVYAQHSGSVAAPTAGLHLTPDIFKQLRTCAVTLHVGYGTFRPVTASTVEAHGMESERYWISGQTARAVARQKKAQGRVVAVGTTTTRALEHAAASSGFRAAVSAEADLFIFPGFAFRVVDALLTNFHLPRSTLLMMVAAFAGRELILNAYREAVEQRYRFYSYGDAMLIV